jgi:hypothetical protein
MGPGTGAVRETYVAAIQHDLVELTGEEHVAGVVRKPTPWFHGAVDENYPELGPPAALLEETKQREEDLKSRGICDAEALNVAWEDTDFADRYREYVRNAEDVAATLAGFRERLDDGQDVVLVCYEGDGKRCHRHLLVEHLENLR